MKTQLKPGILQLGILTIGVILVMGCTAAANPMAADQGVAGFWKGLWHGFILLFTFIIGLFKDGVGIYEVANNGAWYDFGFLLGVMMFWGSSGNKACGLRCGEDKGVIADMREDIRAEVLNEVKQELRKEFKPKGDDGKSSSQASDSQ